MANEALILETAIILAAGLVYAYVGRVTARRQIGGEAQLAVTLFSVWWYTLAALTLSGVVTRLLAYGGITDVGLHSAILHVVLVALVTALWALQYYLFYLFTGSRRWLAPITIYYVLFYLALLYFIAWRQIIGISVTDGTVTYAYAREASRAMSMALGVALVVPTMIGALGYARLFFRVEAPTQRYRIGLVSFTILIWFGLTLVAVATGLNQAPWWQDISRFFGLAAALFILAAYRPPHFVRRRWGIEAVDEHRA